MLKRKLPDNDFDVQFLEDGNIYLVGDNPDFLESKAKTIIKYTAQSYPLTKIPDAKEIKLEKITNEKGYTSAIQLNNILPLIVALIITPDERRNRFININCHGAAQVAAGLFPLVTDSRKPPVGVKFCGSSEVRKEELSTGDIITLDTDHSFVFIDNDICLSSNGSAVRLSFCRTEEVLERYNYPKDVLTTYSKNFRVFRRDIDHTFSESIISTIMEYYRLTVIPAFMWNFERYKLVEKVMFSLYEECVYKNKDNKTLKSIYTMLTKNIPDKLVSRVETQFKDTQNEESAESNLNRSRLKLN